MCKQPLQGCLAPRHEPMPAKLHAHPDGHQRSACYNSRGACTHCMYLRHLLSTRRVENVDVTALHAVDDDAGHTAPADPSQGDSFSASPLHLLQDMTQQLWLHDSPHLGCMVTAKRLSFLKFCWLHARQLGSLKQLSWRIHCNVCCLSCGPFHTTLH